MKHQSKDNTTPLRTNGLLAPFDFPSTPYELIHEAIAATQATHKFYDHYAGAWNAMAYRFRASVDYSDAFVTLLRKHGTTPPPEERYLQESVLFDFFSSGFSTFEATFYGMYVIGSFILPSGFPLASEKDQQRVSPNRTRDAFVVAFPYDPILSAFEELFADSEYQKLREIRNVLTHRTAPGRLIYVSFGNDDTPSTEWKLNKSPLDESIASGGRQQLSRLLTNLLTASEDFVHRRLINQ